MFFCSVFWHSNYSANGFFTPTWVWEVISNPGAVLCFVHFVWPYENQWLPKQLDWDLVERAFKICFKTNPRAVYGVEAQSACNPTALIQSLFIMDCAQCDLLGIYRFSQEDCAFLHKSMDQYGAQQGLMISYGSLKHLTNSWSCLSSCRALHMQFRIWNIMTFITINIPKWPVAKSFKNDQSFPFFVVLFMLSFRSQNITGAASS